MNTRGPRLLIPTGLVLVVIAMLAILTIGTKRGSAPSRLMLVAVLAALISDAWLAYRSLRRVDARFTTPAIATEGTPFSAHAVITGVRRPASVDPLIAGEQTHPFVSARPFNLECPPGQRGMYNHLLIEVRARSPLGLWVAARRIAVHLPHSLAVAPRPRAVPLTPDHPRSIRGIDAARAPVAGAGLVRSIREYQPGDNARLVHWPATAHQGRLMLRETEVDRVAVPVIVVAVRQGGAAAEEALGRAMTYAADALAAAGRVRLITTVGDRPDDEGRIPRSILMPGVPLAPPSMAPAARTTTDAVEETIDAVRARLAAVVPTRPSGGERDDVIVPHGAVWVTDEGDHR